MMRLCLFVGLILVTVNSWGVVPARFRTRSVSSLKMCESEEPKIEKRGDWSEITEKSGVPLKAAPYGKRQFFAADVGAISGKEEFGGGDVGGNEYEDALFHPGPRGKNKPLIGDKAVVKLPSMSQVERGYSEAKAKKVYVSLSLTFKSLYCWHLA